MSTTFKIKFGGSKNEIKPFWLPVIFELRSKEVDKSFHYIVEDFEQDVKSDPDNGSCYFEIKNLQKGHYAFSVLEFDTGHQIFHEPNLALEDEEVAYEVRKKFRTTRQANTYAMDLVVDAPYRLEKSYPYLPVVVYIKDIKPGKIKIKSIEFHNYSPSEGMEYDQLAPHSIFQVKDSKGIILKENDQPLLLRFDAGKDYETIITDPWYRMIWLRRDQLKVYQDEHLGYGNTRFLQYLVNIKYEKFDNYSKQFVFRTLVPEADLPRITDWYYGDSHYHSEFTDNPYEFGGPLPMTAEVAKAIGLSWVTVTDHSYGLSRPKTPEEQGNRWLSYKKAIKETNERYEDVLLVGAEEITVKKFISGLHLLSFNNPFVEDHHLAGFGTFTMEEALDKIQADSTNNAGIIYAAHPSSKGYTWKDNDYKIVTQPKYSNLFVGLQIFNEKILYKRTTQSSMDDGILNPFEMLDESDRQRPWSKELEEGLKTLWVEKFLLPPLKEFRQNGSLRKYYILSGSDAHMDFNYALRPHPAFLIHYLKDNAFGKARTLTYLPKKDGRSLTEKNLYEALRSGKTLLTDGPVALFHFRHKGSDYRFGDTIPFSPGESLELSIEWHSTPEFGAIREIKLYLGTERGEEAITGQIDLPNLNNEEIGLDGDITHVFPDWSVSHCYLRLEASSGFDPQSGEGLFRCITNPIWIITE